MEKVIIVVLFYFNSIHEKKKHWILYAIDRVKCTFALHGSSISEYNHTSVKSLVIENTDGIHRSMYQLMKRQNKLMMNNNDIIVKAYLSVKVINLQYSNSVDEKDIFLFQASKLLSKKEFKVIKNPTKNRRIEDYFSLFNNNGNKSFSGTNNIILPYVMKYSSENCSYFIAKYNMMQCKHIISLNQ